MKYNALYLISFHFLSYFKISKQRNKISFHYSIGLLSNFHQFKTYHFDGMDWWCLRKITMLNNDINKKYIWVIFQEKQMSHWGRNKTGKGRVERNLSQQQSSSSSFHEIIRCSCTNWMVLVPNNKIIFWFRICY